MTNEEKKERREYVERFNLAFGSPSSAVMEMQTEFIEGAMSFDDAVSYLRYCEYMIHSAQERAGKINV